MDQTNNAVDSGERRNSRMTTAVFVSFFVLLFAWGGVWFVHRAFLGASTDIAGAGILAMLTQAVYVSWLIASIALGVAVYLWITRKEQAIVLAEKMTGGVLSYFQQFQQLYDNSPVPYFMLDPSGVIENPNKSAARFFVAPTEAELEGKNLYDMLLTHDDGKEAEAIGLLKTKLERGVTINKQEVQIKLLNNDTRWALLTVFIMEHVGRHNKRVGLAALVDITQEKEIDKVKTEFVSLASHQLRTPLTSVKWQVDMLRTSKVLHVAPEILPYLEKIYHGNERMIELVDTLLNISRIEMGTLGIEPKESDIVQIFEDVIEEVTVSLQEKEITLEKKFDHECSILTDAHLVRIVLQNLLTNAVRYTPAGGLVKVEATKSAGSVVVRVSDTGCGISPEDQKHIFTKMFRAENAQKMVAQGTGLGLYMSKSFIEVLGGSITFESEINKGTTFTVTIPSYKGSHSSAQSNSRY